MIPTTTALINGDDYTLIDNAFNTQGFASNSVEPAEMIASRILAQIASSNRCAGADNSRVNLHGGIAIIAPLAAFDLIRSIGARYLWGESQCLQENFCLADNFPLPQWALSDGCGCRAGFGR